MNRKKWKSLILKSFPIILKKEHYSDKQDFSFNIKIWAIPQKNKYLSTLEHTANYQR